MSNIFTKKHWHNEGQFCNRKHHPDKITFKYRRYRRGKNRCSYCGAKIGKIKCRRYSYKEELTDNLFTSSPLLDLLKRKGDK